MGRRGLKMLLIVTQGPGSLDLYSRRLAENLDVPVFTTDIYQRVAERFNISWLSLKAISALWLDWNFVRKINKIGSIIHFPNHHLGRYGNYLKTPFIITVHDLIRYFDMMSYETFIHPPNSRDRFYLNLDYRGIKKATRIIALSQATKNDLVQHLGISDDRISVVYAGIDHNLFRPVSERIYGDPYILFVGSEHPRKNFTAVVKAFALLRMEHRFKDLKLVKVGSAGGQEADCWTFTVMLSLLILFRQRIFLLTIQVPKHSFGDLYMKFLDCPFWKPWLAVAR